MNNPRPATIPVLALVAVLLLALTAPVAGATGPSTSSRAATLPTISDLTPNTGPTSGGGLVTITGSGFVDVAEVRFGTRTAPILVRSQRRILAAVPRAAEPGRVQVKVITRTGKSATHPGTRYTYLPAPQVESLSSQAGPAGGGGVLTVRGRGFVEVDQVRVGPNPAKFTVVSRKELTIVVPPGGGGVHVRVRTPGGRSLRSEANRYRYIPPPTVTSVSPESGGAEGGDEVLISGTRFGGATAVTFGGVPAAEFTVLSTKQIIATAPARAAGPAQVRVTTTGGRSAPGSSSVYEYLAPLLPPVVTSVTPSSGSTTALANVVISGENFSEASSVMVGFMSVLSFTVVGPEEIWALVPAGPPGTWDVIVTTPAGQSEPGPGATYTFVAPPVVPVVSSVEPGEGPASGGTEVTLTGGDFTDVIDVTFGGVSSPEWEIVSSTQIRAVSPPGTDELAHVVVHTAHGQSAMTMDSEFVYRF